MSNAEHLIENALFLMQDVKKKKLSFDDAFESFFSDSKNIQMAYQNKIQLMDIWDIAQYVTYSWCEGKILDKGCG